MVCCLVVRSLFAAIKKTSGLIDRKYWLTRRKTRFVLRHIDETIIIFLPYILFAKFNKSIFLKNHSCLLRS